MIDGLCKLRVKELYTKNPFSPIYSAVVQVLRDEISSYHLLPGEHLREEETAKKLGVSRSTIRRAFEVMTLEGLLLRRPNNGVEVAPMLLREYREIVEIRSMLDADASRLAALRRVDSDLQEMERNIKLLPISKNIEERAKADVDFHHAIYKASGNPYILRIYNELGVEIIRSRFLSAEGVSDMIERILMEHVEIYEAIRQQDASRAYSVARKHTQILKEQKILNSSFMERYGKRSLED